MAQPDLADLVERIWMKCEWQDECLLFIGATSRGYGAGSYYVGDGRQQSYRTHRVVWESVHGPIPSELTIEHTCGIRTCQNIEHLTLLTAGDNSRAGAHRNPTVITNRAKTHCPQNHPYDEENTYTPPSGGRYCRICGRAASARYYARKKVTA